MDKNIEIFSTIGNHDLPYNNMNYFNTTPLSLLFKSGFVKKLDNLIINNTVIHGLHFSESLDKIELDSEMTNILTMHYALNDTVPYESIKAKDLLNFDMVIAGHDHMYYEPLTVEETTFLRPGSLTRQTKDQYNLERSIVFYVVDLESLEFSEVLVPNVMPAEKVFKNEVFSERSLNLYSNEFNSLFSGDTEEKDLYDIESILEDLPPTVLKKSKEEVIKFLKAKGLNN
jgi:predicted phosphodiesterase